MNIQVRARNKATWLSLSAAGLIIARACGYVVDETQYTQLINAVLGFFVVIGVLNNPTTENTGYSDDK